MSPHRCWALGCPPCNPSNRPTPQVCFWTRFLGKPPQKGPWAVESLPPAQLPTPDASMRRPSLDHNSSRVESHTNPTQCSSQDLTVRKRKLCPPGRSCALDPG